MSDSVDRVFAHALNTVKRIPRSGSVRPPLSERLRLYGLYKQSMEGDVEGVMDRPVGDETSLQAEREKWDAWYAQRQLSRTEAKRRYITVLLDTMNKYASSTPEARELIAELEFVWDQIKSNPSSSSSSGSPVHLSGMSQPPSQQPSHMISTTPPSRSNYSYGSISGRISRAEATVEERMDRPLPAGRDSGLRVLSPVSQPDHDIPGSGRRKYKAHGEGRDGGEEREWGKEGGEDEEDDEDFQEARNSPYEDDDGGDDDDDDEDDDDDDGRSDDINHTRNDTRQRDPGRSDRGRNQDRDQDRTSKATGYNRRWRRRFEQAMTKMTAEVAAMREQMEARALNSRHRSSLWAWIKWAVWIVVRQVCWDILLFGCVLVWMRVVKGDRRLEEKVRRLRIWTEVRRKFAVLVGRGEGRGLGFRLEGFP
ncbi:acyl CoA binding protein [Histoplasma capsulatum H143]|uniref:Acyl CoA binding protein n=1 Tax=Ajellomyces capsulatus (strain H143) TaxID=544712 RepID=C6HII0_AJECH|nr:acyl CoA binding protein [Histoplasma capsulatum H143]